MSEHRKGDPLSAMYVLATLALCLGAIFIVAMMFVPPDWRDRFADDSERYVPGSAPAYTSLGRPAVLDEPVGITQTTPGNFVVVMEAVNWEFRPSEIRVPQGSTVTFRARSGEDYHGIAVTGTPIMLSLRRDTIVVAEHVFEEKGEHLFVCSEYCGAGHAQMSGKVIVE
jgi:heme/copper-type cytochrome/quinol oxidase subunit 2